MTGEQAETEPIILLLTGGKQINVKNKTNTIKLCWGICIELMSGLDRHEKTIA